MRERPSYRNADGDIDLERAVGAEHMRHYTGTMRSGEGDFMVISKELLEESAAALDYDPLLRHGTGQVTRASSSVTVALRPEICWDVCAYYLLLGVHWRASKGEIRRAYVAACARPGGQEQTERLTYITAQLLDEGVRRAYNAVRLGDPFLGDRDVMEQVRRNATREAVRRRLDGEEYATTDEVMEEAGVLPQEKALEMAREAAMGTWSRQWGYYLLDGPLGVPQADTDLLEAWQGMVGAALRARGITMNFAVGLGRQNEALVLRTTKESCIFVATQNGASPQQAMVAVEKGISQGIVISTHHRRH